MTTNGDSEILVVDDDPDLLELIVTVLEQAGFPARSASNGREALDAAE
jgi:CheY-like chemotaxis protein